MHTTTVNVITGEVVQVPYTIKEQAEYDIKQAVLNAGANDRKKACVRTERNAKISVCDWRMLPDVLNGDVWKVYRQALRDVPQQTGFPENVVWPVEP